MELSALLAADVAPNAMSEPARVTAPMSHMRTAQSSANMLSRSTSSTPGPNPPPKNVRFELLITNTSTQYGDEQKARLPMRVNIYMHDDTDSIITTVKNFYGLYDGSGVSFEDRTGNTLIARYQNFTDGMTIYVRVVDGVSTTASIASAANSPRRPRLQAPFDPQSFTTNGNGISRPPSRTAKSKRSTSPQSISGHRSNSVSTVKSRQKKTRVGSIQGDVEMESDSDGGNASVTSSRRGKIDVVASAEISVENIVEGGRRKRARFDSSELPLFVPSQIPLPGSVSSVSPQRRTGPGPAVSPFQSNQHTFSYSLAPSPQSFGHTDSGYRTYSASGSSYARGMHKSGYGSARQSISGPVGGILPTPDPTIGSVISDEDVALQLMRLGDVTNYSTHGRTSTSTMDDAFSGKADASSGEETDGGSEGEELPVGYGPSDSSEEEFEDRGDGSFKGESDGIRPEDLYRKKQERSGSKSSKSSKVRKWKVKTGHQQMSPTESIEHGHQHKGSASNLNFQHFQQPLGEDEEDLSTKPRCQRCRKSKKGCDRQRPCGRCRDAGIGIEGCVSEDEGNGRKGRFGRHMGVPVKKALEQAARESIEGPQEMHYAPLSMAPPPLVGDKSKKRKR